VASEKQAHASAAPPQVGRPCPICGKPSSSEARPFCSKRCADIDLHRWLGGAYAVPTSDPPEQQIGDRDDDS